MLSRSSQRWLRSAAKPSILGSGLLERARSTSLALLGLTAALGLGMVALVLNQAWPLVPGAPLPRIGEARQAVGDATVASAVGSRSAGATLPGGTQTHGSTGLPASAEKGADGTDAPRGALSAPPQVVVSHSPAPAPSDSSPASPPTEPSPAVQQPAQPPAPAAPPTPPSSGPSSSPSPAPSSPPASSPPPQAAVVSSGTGERDHGHGSSKSSGHGGGHSKGADDVDPPQPPEEPAQAPASPPAAPAASETSEDDRSGAPPWSNGSAHDHGHDHGH